MILQELAIRNFRNYSATQIEFSPEVNVLIGQNAQGKTNVIEAISMLSLAKSHRTNRDGEMIRWEEEGSHLTGQVERAQRILKLSMQLLKKGKKVQVNGVEKKKISDFVGHLNVVLFAPEDLLLVKGSPQYRRRFLDMEIGQVSPAYLHDLMQYNKVLHQRNQFLKESQQVDKFNPDLLGIWDDQLVQYGGKIIRKRLQFLNTLVPFAREIHSQISGQRETLELQYQSAVIEQAGDRSLEEQFAILLEQQQKKDLARGVTSVGPHRDDIRVRYNGHDFDTYGSQGQQRTAALSMKLAEIELIRKEVGEYPVLLLDDVLSELDESRQLHLIQTMGERVQTLITTTSTFGLDGFMKDSTRLYRVQNGEIQVER